MKRGRVVWCALLSLYLLTTWPAVSTEAARSSKPKEIVVVGSKVKEVIREAGLRASASLVRALSNQVHEDLADAARRALRNRRRTVRHHDLSCLPMRTSDNILVHPSSLSDLTTGISEI